MLKLIMIISGIVAILVGACLVVLGSTKHKNILFPTGLTLVLMGVFALVGLIGVSMASQHNSILLLDNTVVEEGVDGVEQILFDPTSNQDYCRVKHTDGTITRYYVVDILEYREHEWLEPDVIEKLTPIVVNSPDVEECE